MDAPMEDTAAALMPWNRASLELENGGSIHTKEEVKDALNYRTQQLADLAEQFADVLVGPHWSKEVG